MLRDINKKARESIDSLALCVGITGLEPASSHLASPRADKWNRQVVRGKSQTLDGSILNVI